MSGDCLGRSVTARSFESVVEGSRTCLTLDELDMVVSHELGRSHPPGLPEMDVERLAAHFRRHMGGEKCQDCAEFYEAIKLTAQAAVKAATRAVKVDPASAA